jgi:hypothetical protein
VRILVLLREEKSLCCETDAGVVERTWEGGGVGVELGVEAELALGLVGAGVDREERRRSG